MRSLHGDWTPRDAPADQLRRARRLLARLPASAAAPTAGIRSTANGSSPRSDSRWSIPCGGGVADIASACRSRRKRPPAASATPASSGRAGTDAASSLRRPAEQRLVLHFGAVDYRRRSGSTAVCVGEHEGGYTPFTFDITDVVGPRAACEIVVRAEDDPHDLAKPRGKQDWQLEPHSIWYPRTTGIWQTVWLEQVPATRIGRVAFTPDLARWEIGVEAWLDGERRDDLAARRQAAQRRHAARRRHLSGRQRRSPSRHRAVGSGHRRLPQRAALESRTRRS